MKTYTQAGEEYGYFASLADTEIFERELAYVLLHQTFGFDSPVWFNVGTPRQAFSRPGSRWARPAVIPPAELATGPARALCGALAAFRRAEVVPDGARPVRPSDRLLASRLTW